MRAKTQSEARYQITTGSRYAIVYSGSWRSIVERAYGMAAPGEDVTITNLDSNREILRFKLY